MGNCQDNDSCLTHELWCDLSDKIFEFLSGISLGVLVENRKIQAVAERQDKRVTEQRVFLATN